MMKNRVSTTEEAFAYVLDCNLATVSHLAGKTRLIKGEYERQISIAQTMLNWCIEFKIDVSTTRAYSIMQKKQTVAQWAADIRSKCLRVAADRRVEK